MPINGYKRVRNAQLGQVCVVKEEYLCAKMDKIGQNLGKFCNFPSDTCL